MPARGHHIVQFRTIFVSHNIVRNKIVRCPILTEFTRIHKPLAFHQHFGEFVLSLLPVVNFIRRFFDLSVIVNPYIQRLLRYAQALCSLRVQRREKQRQQHTQ